MVLNSFYFNTLLVDVFMKKLFVFTLFFLVFSLNSSGEPFLKVLSPVKQTVFGKGQVIDFGVVGPGQKIEIIASRETNNFVAGGEASWDRLLIPKEGLPEGWSNEDSYLYESPMKAFVLVSKDAEDGDYFFDLKTYDEYEGTPEILFKGKVSVSKEVLSFEAQNKHVFSGVGQPAVFLLKLVNHGSASDGFIITISGLPKKWSYSKKVFVPFNSEQIVSYELIGFEKGEFPITFEATSLSSNKISKKTNAFLRTETSLLKDASASSHGILLFPTVEQFVYSLLGLLGNLFK